MLFDGMLIAAGGFGLCGIPELLLQAIKEAGTKDLTFASNNAGVDDFGIGILLQTTAGQENDQLLCRRERGIHAPVSVAASSSWNSIRRALWPNGCVPAAAVFPAFTPRPASAR